MTPFAPVCPVCPLGGVAEDDAGRSKGDPVMALNSREVGGVFGARTIEGGLFGS